MPSRTAAVVSAALLSFLAGCKEGSGRDPGTPPCATHEECPARTYCDASGACAPLAPLACRKVADCDEGRTCVEDACVAECDLAANVARREALAAAHPALAVDPASGKQVRSAVKHFASVAGDAAIRCEYAIPYRDLSGDGALQPYEDWTLPAAERAADLVARLDPASARALLAHPALSDVPASGATGVSAATAALVDAGVRFGVTSAATSRPADRAAWANALQARCEASPLGVPFVLSMEPAHVDAPGRVHALGFSRWPPEPAFGAAGDPGRVEAHGRFVAQEYRAIGVRMALSPAANLATDPRWPGSAWSYGEDSATVSALVAGFVRGAQGAALGRESVAVVVGHFPGAGAAKGGWDARLAKGRFTAYPGGRFDDHARAFEGALAAGVAGVMPGYGVPERGAWTGFGGVVDGATIEQRGASFNATLLRSLLREHLGFGGLVVAPAGVVEDPAVAPLGAPWGVEELSRPQRIAAAVAAGVDQLVGVGPEALALAGLPPAQVTATATRALTLAFALGLFEDPYVDAAAPGTAGGPTDTDGMYAAALEAMRGGFVLLRNDLKPAGWLDGNGDGTQRGDRYNAGNGTRRVLPAPPGGPYLLISNFAYFAGDFHLAAVERIAAAYTSPMNWASSCGWSRETAISTDAARMACSDYVFVRLAAPGTPDPDSGPLALPLPSLTWAGNDAAALAPVAAARAAIDAWVGPPASRAQLVVFVDAGRPSVVAELLSGTHGVDALYVDWGGALPGDTRREQAALDVAFGIVDGEGKLPFALAASDEAAAAQLPDLAGDGADVPFERGFGLETTGFLTPAP